MVVESVEVKAGETVLAVCPSCGQEMEEGENERFTYRSVPERVYSTGPGGSPFRLRSEERPQMEKITWTVPVFVCACGFAVSQVDYPNLSCEEWYPVCRSGHTRGWLLIRRLGRRRDLHCVQSMPERICDMRKSVFPPGGRQGFLNPATSSRPRGWSKLPILGALVQFGNDGCLWDELRMVVPSEYSDPVIRGVLRRAMGGKSPYVFRSAEKELQVQGWESYRYFVSQRGQVLIQLWRSRQSG